MTPDAHNRYLGLAHFAYGVTNLLLIVVISVLMYRRGSWDREDLIITTVSVAVVGFMNLVFTMPSFVAAGALLKRKPWAKMAAIIAGTVAAMYFPFGPAVTVYTFWFLFKGPGRELYNKLPQSLPPAPPNWIPQPEIGKHPSQIPD